MGGEMMTGRNRVHAVLLGLIILGALALRVWNLGDLPAGLYCDEAGLGWNGYAIARAGMDENGRRWPLFVWSFGVSYKNPGYIYPTALSVAALGLDEFSTRLPAALFGTATVAAIFFAGRALGGPFAGLAAALFLAVCPWHLHFSRIAFELISFPFLFVVGFALLVRFEQGRRTLPAAAVFFGLCAYAYAIAHLFVPLFLAGFALVQLPLLVRRWRESTAALVLLALTAAPAAWFLYQRQATGTRYFRNTTWLDPRAPILSQAQRFARNYREFFSASFLFETGDPIVRHAVRGHGELLPFFAPFLVLGSAVVLFRRERSGKLLLWWLALYPVGASLMTEIPSATRGIIGAPAFCLLAGLGAGSILTLLGRLPGTRVPRAAQIAAVLGGLGVLAPQVHGYLRDYIVEYPKYSAPTYGGFQYGYREVIQYMESQRSAYDRLMLTATEVNQPHIFVLFYRRMDPRDWVTRRQLGYSIVDPADFAAYSPQQRVLFALRPKDLQYFSRYEVKKEVIAPGGQRPFVVAEILERKRFVDQWLALGLFDNRDKVGERSEAIDPRVPTRIPATVVSGPARWRPVVQRSVRVDLNRFFHGASWSDPRNPEWVCAYTASTVISPRETDVIVEIAGSDDPVRVWLDGRPLAPGQLMLGDQTRRLAAHLRAGPNLLLVKSCETIGDWWFTVRITDADGNDLRDLRFEARLPPVVPPGE